jgi:ketosteroid isomerase-like protein
MRRILLATAVVLFGVFSGSAQASSEDEHIALRKLKDDLAQAVSKRDFDAAQKVLHQPFMATLVTQDSFTDMAHLKSYFDGLFTRSSLRIKDLSITPQADELSQIYTGTLALTKGSTAEHYQMDDGRNFDLNGRWTAVSIKENDGTWKLLAFHSGVNFLDNPVLTAIEKSVVWVGLAGAGGGLLIGFLVGWIFKRRQLQAR